MSIFLQANWHDQSLYLWARCDGGQGPADLAALRAAGGEGSSDALLASVAAEATLAIALPVDEPRGEQDEGQVATATRTRVTRVTALALGPAEAIDFLTSLPPEIPASCGASVGYWAKIARLVIRLIAA